MTEKDFMTGQEVESPTHNCGICVMYTYSPTSKAQSVFNMGIALQHRGQHGFGFCSDSINQKIGASGLLDRKVDSDTLDSLNNPCHYLMVHLRYGTSGGYDKANLQPIQVETPSGLASVAVNGNIPYSQNLRRYLSASVNQCLSDGVSDTLIAAHVLASLPGHSFDERMLAFSRIDEIRHSANNMIVAIGKDIYVLRDMYGIHPLVMGNIEGGVIIASETSALQSIGVQTSCEFPPGQLLRISTDGMRVLHEGSFERLARCSFEPTYFSGPNHCFSTFENPNDWNNPQNWMSTVRFKRRTGEIVARESPVSADWIVGMADSGIPFAMGYSNESDIGLNPGLTRSHYGDNGNGVRTFMRDEHMLSIPDHVRGKHMPVIDPKDWEGKDIIFADDSLVRGNTAKTVTDMFRNLGVRKIHWRLGFPPILSPCPLGVSFRSEDELIAARNNNDWRKIADEIGADSVAFISHKGLIEASREDRYVRIPENDQDIFLANKWCGGCMTGIYPTSFKALG